jgi:hypothetical protein
MLDAATLETTFIALKEAHGLYQSTLEMLKPAFGSLVETPLTDAVASMLNQHIRSVSAMLEDLEDCWVPWYVWDTQCGDHPMTATVDGVEYEINSPQRMTILILDLLKRKAA